MADVSWDDPLLPDQRANPVVYSAYVELPPSVRVPTNDQLEKIFVTKGYKLQTWGRSKAADGKYVKTNDPHWIGVRNGTPLHTDRSYPRYSHHLKVRVDSGIVVRGKNKEELQLKRGVFYILDTHSPHQVLHKNKDGVWNVAVSIDSDTILEPADCISRSIIYAMTTDITKK
jgi:hypothetical protein